MHWVAVDMNFLCWRAYHSIGHAAPRPAVLIAALQMERLRVQLDPDAVAVVCFDRGPYKRVELCSAYKQKRTRNEGMSDEMDRLRRKYLPTLGINNILSRQGYEADDMIANVVRSTPASDQVTIVCSDSDLCQLLSKRVVIYNPVKQAHYHASHFKAEHGIHPSQWADVKALAGCGTDDVTGAAGVGIKTAVKYLLGEPIGPKAATNIKQHEQVGQFDVCKRVVSLPFEGLEPFNSHVIDSWVGQEWAGDEEWTALCHDLEVPQVAVQMLSNKRAR